MELQVYPHLKAPQRGLAQNLVKQDSVHCSPMFEGTGMCCCHQGTRTRPPLPPSVPSGCKGTALSKCHHKTDHQRRDGLTSLCHAASALLAQRSFSSSRTPARLVLQESLVGQTLRTAWEQLTKPLRAAGHPQARSQRAFPFGKPRSYTNMISLLRSSQK